MAAVLTSLTFRAVLPKLCPEPGFWWGGGWCSLVSPLSTGRCLQKEILPLGQGMLWMIHNTLKAFTPCNRPIAFSSLGLFFFFLVSSFLGHPDIKITQGDYLLS